VIRSPGRKEIARRLAPPPLSRYALEIKAPPITVSLDEGLLEARVRIAAHVDPEAVDLTDQVEVISIGLVMPP